MDLNSFPLFGSHFVSWLKLFTIRRMVPHGSFKSRLSQPLPKAERKKEASILGSSYFDADLVFESAGMAE